MRNIEIELEQEKEFWQSLISTSNLDPSSQEMIRMSEALALIVYKLHKQRPSNEVLLAWVQ